MGAYTFIGWTHSTLNPWTERCKPVAPECFNCFAEKRADRFGGPGTFRSGPPVLKPHRLVLPWTDPGIRDGGDVFLTSQMDPFHPGISLDDQVRVWAMMAAARHLLWQVLTKRPEIALKLLTRADFPGRVRAAMAEYITLLTPPSGRLSPLRRAWIAAIEEAIDTFLWPLPNVVLGVSAGSQATAEKFIPPLLSTPAARRFVSAEPLIGALSLQYVNWTPPIREGYPGTHNPLNGEWWPAVGDYEEEYAGRLIEQPRLDWVIVGGESGKVYGPDPWNPPMNEAGETGGFARPMDLEWARRIVRECRDTDVPVFVKQLGSVQAHLMGLASRKGEDASEWPPVAADLVVRQGVEATS